MNTYFSFLLAPLPSTPSFALSLHLSSARSLPSLLASPHPHSFTIPSLLALPPAPPPLGSGAIKHKATREAGRDTGVKKSICMTVHDGRRYRIHHLLGGASRESIVNANPIQHPAALPPSCSPTALPPAHPPARQPSGARDISIVHLLMVLFHRGISPFSSIIS